MYMWGRTTNDNRTFDKFMVLKYSFKFYYDLD